MLVYLLLLALSGLLIGALARLALPGPDPMSIPATIGLGLAGAIVGGVVVRVLFHAAGPGILVSVVCATLILWGIRRARGQRVHPYNWRR
ncbi:MAG: GlsB/YeaQ/YmgE family stress response membrane protein [Actinobacteria bacterium]|nr:GlsB/YeaQ/YmgE family stress response membrane protein [Actinomycetota bacterium]